ncbi:FeoB-associated Cys-rich membrane protein [Kineothrix sedimenti]|uniref:FeoB-associated Cys-rich membrane protein n=1 Tax=Kineothrix sedimenti TaxID=3123317 RepID=A0ABZ3EPP2_9FIRM
MGTIIVGAIVLGLAAIAIGSMIRDKKNGKSIQCGADCKHCGGHCGQ